MQEDFRRKIDDRSARIGIIGLGYVGLPLVMEFARAGFPTTGFDIDNTKIEALEQGETYLRHMSASLITDLNDTGNFTGTTDFSSLAGMDVIIICVPTPLTEHREPDLTYIISTGETIRDTLTPGQLIILESTTYPGTTDEVLLPLLEESGLVCGGDFHLAFSPEREDPGNASFTTHTIPKVVGGLTVEGTERAVHLYSQVVATVVPVSSTRTAEAVKLTENIFRAVNIALVNELKMIYTRMDIDVWEVIEAAKTKPFGFMPFYPGPGLGGHCIPIDPFYLTWKAREYESPTRFIEIAGEINTSMPRYVVEVAADALNDHGKALKGSRVLIVGLAYKKDVGDHRESPSFKLMELLAAKGAEIAYHDNYIPVIGKTREYSRFEGMESVPLNDDFLAGFDLVLIATDHSYIDYERLVARSRIVVDTRNATKHVTSGREKIYKG